MWLFFSVLSALFASLTSILAKIGIEHIPSNTATAIRTTVVVIMAWGIVMLTNGLGSAAAVSRKSWIFLIASGLATGASWLCYYKALQLGAVSKVAAVDKFSIVLTVALAVIVLHEKWTIKTLCGCLLITAGTVLMIL